MNRLGIAIFLMVTLSGCTELVILPLMNGEKPCPANEVNKVYDNRKMMPYIQEGMPAYKVAYLMKYNPAFQKMYKLKNGRTVRGVYYRFREPDTCPYALDYPYEYEAVYFEKDHVIGMKMPFFKQKISPQLSRRDRTNVVSSRL